MTMPDLGSERPGEATETRQLAERGRTEPGGETNVSDRQFLIALAVIVIVIAVFAIVLWL